LNSRLLRLAYGRRYGLVGKNGVGKTTLFKAIAFMQIEGFPRHHRVLHVRQEVAHVPKGSPASSDGDRNCFALTRETDEMSILQSVIKSDVERIIQSQGVPGPNREDSRKLHSQKHSGGGGVIGVESPNN